MNVLCVKSWTKNDHEYFTKNKVYKVKELSFGNMAWDNGKVGRYIDDKIPEYFIFCIGSSKFVNRKRGAI